MSASALSRQNQNICVPSSSPAPALLKSEEELKSVRFFSGVLYQSRKTDVLMVPLPTPLTIWAASLFATLFTLTIKIDLHNSTLQPNKHSSLKE